MSLFAARLRQRARQLHLPDAEIARRAGLTERRYGHYVRGAREPDFVTLLRICSVLSLTPNDLLLPPEPRRPSTRGRWLSRLVYAGQKLDLDSLEIAVRQVEVLLAHMKPDKTKCS
jgi:transcriptional regulator with XRE-family HTH domain